MLVNRNVSHDETKYETDNKSNFSSANSFKENEEVGEKTRNSIFWGKTFYIKVTSPSIYGNRIKIEHYETVVENIDKNGKYRGKK